MEGPEIQRESSTKPEKKADSCVQDILIAEIDPS